MACKRTSASPSRWLKSNGPLRIQLLAARPCCHSLRSGAASRLTRVSFCVCVRVRVLSCLATCVRAWPRRSCGTPVPIGERALQLYDASADAGWKNKDFSSIYKFLEGLQK
jgi:hypothetical protein